MDRLAIIQGQKIVETAIGQLKRKVETMDLAIIKAKKLLNNGWIFQLKKRLKLWMDWL